MCGAVKTEGMCIVLIRDDRCLKFGNILRKKHALFTTNFLDSVAGSEPQAHSTNHICSELKNSDICYHCLLYTSPSPRDATLSRMPSSA